MRRLYILISLFTLVLGVSCSTSPKSKTVNPDREYERMIVGRLDAQYVGTDNCVSRCHRHDKITDDFKHSVHSEQIKPETGLPLVNCESCHGPGSLAIADIPDDPEANSRLSRKCDTSTLLDVRNLPPQAQSLICLKCHSLVSKSMLAHWKTGAHAVNGVSCFDCHKLHQGPQQKVSHSEVAALCYGCHAGIKEKNGHQFPDGKMACVDCHEVHGNTSAHLLRDMTPKETSRGMSHGKQ